MTFYQRRRLLGLAGTLSLTSALMATSFDGLASVSTQHTIPPTTTYSAGSVNSPQTTLWSELEVESTDAWERLRSGFAWQETWENQAGEQRVRYWINRYLESPRNIAMISERARPWLGWIIQKVEARGLPSEIALLPFVESAFDPNAKSHMGAAGLWQIMPRTGDALGLQRSRSWDGRLDVVNSTRAALDYIELQAEQWYEGDLELSLAAYNAGAGTVNKARRAATAQGNGETYWDLALPSETMDYVPKLLAISSIINDPEKYGIDLPAINTTPTFASVKVTAPLTLDTAAKHLGITSQQLAELNPGLKSHTAHPRQVRELQVPVERQPLLVAALNQQVPASQTVSDAIHVVQRGDTLSRIASRHAVSPIDLARWNGIRHNATLQPGQQLTTSE
ncbi:transglycosylase SLT domain-containing protein [Halomonas halocynthiae]|uniref:transglycosylase SLT domain-containing protein n=1 Tax=Halomonas halocynthiae TaxID=176290 RepID=UPI00041A35F4|nr:transglycosylase SLT domain-containing protein [Halomonas halocynthiae]